MQFKNEYLQAIQAYVPEGFQKNASNFMYYLKTMTEKRHDRQYDSLDVKKNGIEVLIYRPQYTPTQFFTWSELTRLVEKEYNAVFPSTYEQLRAQLW